MESAVRPISTAAYAPLGYLNLFTVQWLLVGAAILDTSIQIDTYMFYQDRWADVGAIGGVNLSVATFSVLLLYFLWLVEASVSLRPRKPVYFNLPLTLYVAVASASWFVANEKLLAVNTLALLFQGYLLYTYLANKIQTREQLLYVVCLFAVATAIQGLVMIAVRAVGHDIVMGPVTAMASDEGRMGGTIGSPVTGGSFLALMFAPVLSLLMVPVRRELKQLAFVALFLGTIGLVLTQTRGSFIGVGLSASLLVVLMCLRGWLPLRIPIVLGFVGLTLAGLLQGQISDRIFGDDKGSAEGRLPLFRMAWQMICDHPIVGVGVNNCAASAGPYAARYEMRGEWFWTIHNRYLLEWVETGIVGLAVLLWFLFDTLWTGWIGWWRRDRLLSPIALAITLAIVGQMIHMTVDVFNSRPQIQTLWECAALLAAIRRIQEAA